MKRIACHWHPPAPRRPASRPGEGGFTANSANMSRTTTILGLLQTILLVGGFLALGMVLKVSGYPDSTEVRWNPLAVFLREHGGVAVASACFVGALRHHDPDARPRFLFPPTGLRHRAWSGGLHHCGLSLCSRVPVHSAILLQCPLNATHSSAARLLRPAEAGK